MQKNTLMKYHQGVHIPFCCNKFC